MEIQASVDRVLPRNFVRSLLDYATTAHFEKTKKMIAVPGFWGSRMETTSKNELDPAEPPKDGKRVKQ